MPSARIYRHDFKPDNLGNDLQYIYAIRCIRIIPGSEEEPYLVWRVGQRGQQERLPRRPSANPQQDLQELIVDAQHQLTQQGWIFPLS